MTQRPHAVRVQLHARTATPRGRAGALTCWSVCLGRVWSPCVSCRSRSCVETSLNREAKKPRGLWLGKGLLGGGEAPHLQCVRGPPAISSLLP